MNTGLLCAGMTCATLLCLAAEGCARRGGLYVTPEHQDLGTLANGQDKAVAEYAIVNELDCQVRIVQIFPSCQCASVELDRMLIEPGEIIPLKVIANLAKRPGRQDYTVVLLTDNPSFPKKRLSFSAIVPANGVREREYSIGSFYPGADINLPIPVSSFSQGEVKVLGVSGAVGEDKLSVEISNTPTSDETATINLRGRAPERAGEFKRVVQLQENFPNEVSVGTGTVELELIGRVVPRWQVPRELYGGFVSASSSRGIAVSIARQPTEEATSDSIEDVSVEFSEKWLTGVGQSVENDEIRLQINIVPAANVELGPRQSKMRIKVKYSDGKVEFYSSLFFVRVNE